MANEWTEIMGTRKSEETTQYIDHIVTAEAATTNPPVLPPQGEVYANVMATTQSTLAPSTTNLVTAVVVLQASFAKRGATKGYDRVLIRFRGFKSESA